MPSPRLTASVAFVLAVAAWPAHAAPQNPQPPRPTVIEALNAVHIAYDNYADVTRHVLVIGRCPPVGRRSRACDVVLSGPVPQGWRVIVTERPDDFPVHGALAP